MPAPLMPWLITCWDLFLAEPNRRGGQADNSWDIQSLRSAVAVQGTRNRSVDSDQGWTLEIAYPLDAFRSRQDAPPLQVGTTRPINFSRVECKAGQPKEESLVWSPQGPVNRHIPERWVFLNFHK